MVDLFEREQLIYDNAVNEISEAKNGASCGVEEFEALAREYGRLLKQLRRITKISDRTTIDLNASKQDLLCKVNYDALTGVYNRRFMEDSMKRIIRTSSRSKSMLSVLMLDVDFFKKYNDTYGHTMGDACLKAVAQALKSGITRADDFVARYGGEEFVIVLPNTCGDGARGIAERLLQNIRELKIPHEKNTAAEFVTASLGVTAASVDNTQKAGDYIKRADEALYISKNSGRNRYTFINFREETQ